MGWRSSRVHLARLMHRTGSSNGRVGHEYLINNYYRETLYFCERKRAVGSPLSPAPPYHHRPKDPSVLLLLSLSFMFPLTLFLLFPPPSAIVPGSLSSLPQRRASCRHICIFIRECNRRARFSPLVARCRGKNSRKMAERFEVDMRSDFLLHSLSPLYSSPLPTLPHPSVPRCPFSLPPSRLPA